MTSVHFSWDIGFKKPRPILRGSPLYLKLPVSCNVSFWWSSRASLVLNLFSQESLLQRKKTPACWRILKRNWQLFQQCYKTICLVESRTQDAAANSGELSVLPHACSVSLTSVVHWHWVTMAELAARSRHDWEIVGSKLRWFHKSDLPQKDA